MWYSAQLEYLYTAALGVREASGLMQGSDLCYWQCHHWARGNWGAKLKKRGRISPPQTIMWLFFFSSYTV